MFAQLSKQSLSPIAPMGYIAHNKVMNDTLNNRKERVRAAFSAAPVNRAMIARELDIPYPSLSSFVSRGYLAPEHFLKLENYLAARGHLPMEAVRREEEGQIQSIAKKLRRLADELEDPREDIEIRIETFQAFIAAYYKRAEQVAEKIRAEAGSASKSAK